jgi:hypothetical protein
MKFVGKSKIGKLSAKGIEYPQLRLPKSYAQAIGDTANIFETQYEGKQAFLIVTERSVSNNNIVLKNNQEVLKPEFESITDDRLSALESEISELKSSLLSNEATHDNESNKEKAEGEIRTRVVASTGPLPLPTAQMCHKTSFDLSCRTG